MGTSKQVDVPTQAKVAQQSAGVGIGAALAVIVVWGLGQAGINMPDEVVVAVGSAIGAAVQEASALIGAWKTQR